VTELSIDNAHSSRDWQGAPEAGVAPKNSFRSRYLGRTEIHAAVLLNLDSGRQSRNPRCHVVQSQILNGR